MDTNKFDELLKKCTNKEEFIDLAKLKEIKNEIIKENIKYPKEKK